MKIAKGDVLFYMPGRFARKLFGLMKTAEKKSTVPKENECELQRLTIEMLKGIIADAKHKGVEL